MTDFFIAQYLKAKIKIYVTNRASQTEATDPLKLEIELESLYSSAPPARVSPLYAKVRRPSSTQSQELARFAWMQNKMLPPHSLKMNRF